MLSLSKVIAFSVSVAPVLAHFTLDYPQTRGFNEDMEPEFCGGFPVSTNRSKFPLAGGMIEIDSHHTQSVFVTLISFDANPTNFAQFNTSPSGQSYGFLKPFIQLQGTGEMCVPVNISALGVSGVGDGTNATIQVQFNGGDGDLYQCADVTLTSQAVQALPCTNTSTFVSVSSSDSLNTTTSSAAAPSATTTKKSRADKVIVVSRLVPLSFGLGLLGLASLV